MIDDLNRTLGIAGHVRFESGQGDLPRALIRNAFATAEVYLHGAHVTAFQPRGAERLLWLSELAEFVSDKAIRGGIPVVWPWFGPHPTDGSMPQHGFARVSNWKVAETRALRDGRTRICLQLTNTRESVELWPYSFALELTVTVGKELHVELKSRNTGNRAMPVGGALHTYFGVGDTERVAIEGLENRDYMDQLDGHRIKRTENSISISEEVDRIYLESSDDCVIVDPVVHRRVRVSKSGSLTTVVWNPWIEKSRRMADFPDDGYRTMVCIEAANAAADVRSVPPGGEHVLSQTISQSEW